MGVCTAWISGDDLAQAEPKVANRDDLDLDAAAKAASDMLFEVSQRRFPGVCTRTVRPCNPVCGCGFTQVLEGSGHLIPSPWRWDRDRWHCSDGFSCGCGIVPAILLGGHVRQVTRVTIDGTVVAPSAYTVKDRQYLVRKDGALWPWCQNLAADDDQPGTFCVTYEWGVMAPSAGQLAAIELGVQIALAMSSQPSRLAAFGVTQITRQGVTMTRQQLQKIRSGESGLPMVDAFLNAYNPKGRRSRTAVWSPDVLPLPGELR
jgi:hypothetical protein